MPADVKEKCFPSILNGLLDTENERNWRYRDSLAEYVTIYSSPTITSHLSTLLLIVTTPAFIINRQLALLCEQFNCSFIEKHIIQVAIKLGYDRVSQVRESASKLVKCPPFCLSLFSLLSDRSDSTQVQSVST